MKKVDSPSIDIIYFSWTGNTKAVVEVIAAELRPRTQVRVLEVRPKRRYPYFVWLLLSFIPGLGTDIGPVDVTSPLVILAIPKWTVNCPPITTLLRKGIFKGRMIFPVITYGGFDEKRYAENYRRRIERVAWGTGRMLLVRRSWIRKGDFVSVREWAAALPLGWFPSGVERT